MISALPGERNQSHDCHLRNALEVLGVRVVVHEPTDTYGLPSDALGIGNGQEWLSAREAGKLLGVHAKTIRFYQKNGTITQYKEEPFLLVHRDELLKLHKKGFLQRNTEEIVRSRVEISYSPRFTIRGENGTGVQLSKQNDWAFLSQAQVSPSLSSQ